MYLSVLTRPDVVFAVSTLSRFSNNLDANHWNAVKRILAYLLGTIDVGITYQKAMELPVN